MAEFELRTDAPEVDARGWFSILNGLLGTVEQIGLRTAEGDKLTMRIRHLASGSATFVCDVSGVGADGAVTGLIEGVAALNVRDEIPDSMTEGEVKRLADALRDVQRTGLEALHLSAGHLRATITPTTRENARNAVKAVDVSAGSIIGTLEKLDVHQRHEARLYDYRDGRGVRVLFPKELRFDVIEAIHQNALVELWGELHRDRSGRVEKVELAGIDQVEPVTVTVHDVFGIDPAYTGEQSTVEWVREQRG